MPPSRQIPSSPFPVQSSRCALDYMDPLWRGSLAVGGRDLADIWLVATTTTANPTVDEVEIINKLSLIFIRIGQAVGLWIYMAGGVFDPIRSDQEKENASHARPTGRNSDGPGRGMKL